MSQAITQISNLWTPTEWLTAVREKQATFPSIFTSGLVKQTEQMNAIASGGGISANIPMWKDSTDEDDEAQVEDTAPITTHGVTADLMVAPIVNRVFKNGGTALAAAITGQGDPIDEMAAQLLQGRLKRRQKRLLAILRGVFGTGATHARNAAAALAAARLGGTTSEPFQENALGAGQDQLFSPDMFIDAKALMGELAGDLRGGILFMHSVIRARLEKLDKDGFKTGKPSDLPFEITTYREIPIVISDSLVRAATGGYVYDTYLAARETVGFGEKAQVAGALNNPIKDVASLNMAVDADKNNEYIWDRTRETMLVNGTKWGGTPGGQSATNAELQTPGNWSLIYQTANRAGIVAIRTNG